MMLRVELVAYDPDWLPEDGKTFTYLAFRRAPLDEVQDVIEKLPGHLKEESVPSL